MSLLLIFALGCDDTSPVDDTGYETEEVPPPEFPPYSEEEEEGGCPTFEEGLNSGFRSHGQQRRFTLILPDEPQGAPLVFNWHPLGWDGTGWIDAMALDEWAEDIGAIVVVPESCCSPFEWMFMSSAVDNEDLVFFDDALNCLWQQYEYDHTRIHSTGLSAGGLWTTYLTMYRSEWLASTATFSGGTEGFISWSTPEDPIPVLVSWGGESDLWNGYDFDLASQSFSADMQASGSFVLECDHGLGHSIPRSGFEWAWTFLSDHPKDVAPEPYDDGLPDDFPSYCVIP